MYCLDSLTFVLVKISKVVLFICYLGRWNRWGLNCTLWQKVPGKFHIVRLTDAYKNLEKNTHRERKWNKPLPAVKKKGLCSPACQCSRTDRGSSVLLNQLLELCGPLFPPATITKLDPFPSSHSHLRHIIIILLIILFTRFWCFYWFANQLCGKNHGDICSSLYHSSDTPNI
jgi:hypothetical protein